MARQLSGSELAGFIKERQAYQVRNLRQEHSIVPKLVIFVPQGADDVIKKYVDLKRAYASDVLIDIDVVVCPDEDMSRKIDASNADPTTHGIIVQLPLVDPSLTDNIVSHIAPEKDVDGLSPGSHYISATAQAIDWLLSGYNVDLKGKKIAIVGQGRLVGKPLTNMWLSQGLAVRALDIDSKDTDRVLVKSDIIISAVGTPRLITNERVPKNAVVIDAGTASEDGAIVGDVDDAVRDRKDVSITPKIGGVGPMTIAVMFDHVIQAALRQAGKL